jgi:hypothetical protein
MRLLKYINYSPLPKEVNLFRAMSIKLNDKPKDYSKILESIDNHERVDQILYRINMKLKNIYRGKYSLSLCLDEGIKEEKIRLKEKYINKIKEILLTSNDELSKIKESIEKN